MTGRRRLAQWRGAFNGCDGKSYLCDSQTYEKTSDGRWSQTTIHRCHMTLCAAGRCIVDCSVIYENWVLSLKTKQPFLAQFSRKMSDFVYSCQRLGGARRRLELSLKSPLRALLRQSDSRRPFHASLRYLTF